MKNNNKVNISYDLLSEYINMVAYILIVGQEANFQSRVMLIPANEFFSVEARSNDFEILKKHSLKYHKIKVDNVEYCIDNLLILNLIKSNKYQIDGHEFEKTEYLEICHKLIDYANGTEYVFDEDDKIWYSKAIILLNTGFNHLENYIKYKNTNNIDTYKNIIIVESFLILEAEEGKCHLSQFNTVNEMYNELYHQNAV